MLKAVTNLVNVSQITGVLPVVNGGTGVTTSTGTGNTVLSDAPTLSGNVTLSTGNIIQGTAAKGINFTANTATAGSTSRLLNWYEEGTWTPGLTASTSGTITLTSPTNSMRYTRIGRMVYVGGTITVSSTSLPVGDLRITGLPFNANANSSGSLSVFNFLNVTAVTAYQILIDASLPTNVIIRGFLNGAAVATVANNTTAGCGLYLNASYSI